MSGLSSLATLRSSSPLRNPASTACATSAASALQSSVALRRLSLPQESHTRTRVSFDLCWLPPSVAERWSPRQPNPRRATQPPRRTAPAVSISGALRVQPVVLGLCSGGDERTWDCSRCSALPFGCCRPVFRTFGVRLCLNVYCSMCSVSVELELESGRGALGHHSEHRAPSPARGSLQGKHSVLQSNAKMNKGGEL